MKASAEIVGLAELEVLWATAPHLVQDELLRAMTEADALLEREVKDLMPTATGVSRASVFSRETALPMGALGVVGSTLPQVAYIELGTRPHFPPLEPLRDWVRVKFGYTKEAQVNATALAIARKIAARGTLGVGMFHRSFARLRPRLGGIFEAARDRVAQRLAGGRA